MRCNVGVNPLYLPDQHLVAEYRELPMVIGSLEYWKWQIKSPIPDEFGLGTGHMNFFKKRLRYLQRRHLAVIEECKVRDFKCDALQITIDDYDDFYCDDWTPTLEDSKKIRDRISLRIRDRFETKPKFWKYYRETLNRDTMEMLINQIQTGELYPV